jgi:hypothetical protein
MLFKEFIGSLKTSKGINLDLWGILEDWGHQQSIQIVRVRIK